MLCMQAVKSGGGKAFRPIREQAAYRAKHNIFSPQNCGGNKARPVYDV